MQTVFHKFIMLFTIAYLLGGCDAVLVEEDYVNGISIVTDQSAYVLTRTGETYNTIVSVEIRNDTSDQLYLVGYCDEIIKPYKDLIRFGESAIVASVENYSCARNGEVKYKNLIPVPAGGTYTDQFSFDYKSIFSLEEQDTTGTYPSIRTTKQTADLQLKYMLIREVRYSGRIVLQAVLPEEVRVSNVFDAEIIANWW